MHHEEVYGPTLGWVADMSSLIELAIDAETIWMRRLHRGQKKKNIVD